jgi:hypothetical protein
VEDCGRGDRLMVRGVSVAVWIDESELPLVADRDLHSSGVTRECTAGLIAGRATGGGEIDGGPRRRCE